MSTHKPFESRYKNSFRKDSVADSESSQFESAHIDSIQVNYKQKTFELMKKNTKLELMLKQSQRDVGFLEKSIEELKCQMEEIFEVFGISFQDTRDSQAFDRAVSEMQSLLRVAFREKRQAEESCRPSQWHTGMHSQSLNLNNSCQCDEKFNQLLVEYKQIIEAQHQNFQNKNQKLQSIERELKETKKNEEALKQANIAMQEQQLILQQQLHSMRTEIESIKTSSTLRIAQLQDEITALQQDSEQILRQKEIVAQKYKKEIEHFEQMEVIVEEKLIEVEQEMRFYKTERVEQLRLIHSLKKELAGKKQEHYYSFGEREKDAETQTGERLRTSEHDKEGELDSRNWETNCYEESIRTLLLENQRLKMALLNLYQREKDAKLDEQTEIELKMLMATLG